MAKSKAVKREARPTSGRVKAQIVIPHDLLIKLDHLAVRAGVTRSAYVEALIRADARRVVVSFREVGDEAVESAA